MRILTKARQVIQLTPNKGVGVPGPYPAPSGYRWAVVVENGNRVMENGNRVVELQRAA